MPANGELFRLMARECGVFVETGSFTGGGIRDALKAGFRRVISIEIAPHYHSMCQKMYQHDKRVQVVLGDSAIKMAEVIRDIDEPIAFWLDGHFSGLDTGFGIKGAPIIEELEQIRQHKHSRHHWIAIDDRRMLKKTGNLGKDTYFELNETEVTDKLKQINPHFKFSYHHGHTTDDIILATPSQHSPNKPSSAANVELAQTRMGTELRGAGGVEEKTPVVLNDHRAPNQKQKQKQNQQKQQKPHHCNCLTQAGRHKQTIGASSITNTRVYKNHSKKSDDNHKKRSVSMYAGMADVFLRQRPAQTRAQYGRLINHKK